MNKRRRRVTYRPSRANAGFSAVVGVIFVLIGIFVVIPSAGPFGIIWTLLAIGITAYNAYLAFGKKYIGPEIHIEDDTVPEEQSTRAGEAGPDTEERLIQLRELYDKDLISAEEYERKRQQILDEL